MEDPMRLRQVALVAKELEPTINDMIDTFGLGEPYPDPGVETFGLRNAVMPVGDTFLEVVSPKEPGTTAGRLLDRRGGDGGYMVILQTDDLAADRERIESLGIRIVWKIDLGDAASLHLHPRDVGGAILSLDAMDPPESWRWAGPEWDERNPTHVVSAIVGVEIQADDPDAMAARWAEVLGIEVNGRELALEDSWIRFVPVEDGRGEGVSGIDFAVRDRDFIAREASKRGLVHTKDRVEVAGIRVRLV
jgi:hypothetical protein